MIKYLPWISIKKVVNLYSSPKNQYILNFCRICYTLFCCYSRQAQLRLGTGLFFPHPSAPPPRMKTKQRSFTINKTSWFFTENPWIAWEGGKKNLTINGAFFFSAGYIIQGSGQYSNRGPFFCSAREFRKEAWSPFRASPSQSQGSVKPIFHALSDCFWGPISALLHGFFAESLSSRKKRSWVSPYFDHFSHYSV